MFTPFCLSLPSSLSRVVALTVSTSNLGQRNLSLGFESGDTVSEEYTRESLLVQANSRVMTGPTVPM